MSNLSALPSLELLLIAGRSIALIGALALFAWGFIRWRRAIQCDTQRVFEQLDLVRADLLTMKEAMQTTALRVDSAAQRIAHDVRVAPAHSGPATGRGYEIAARLARSGAGKEELVKSCGITAHEAELLVKLHGRASQVVAPTSTKASPQSSATSNATDRQVRRPTPTAAQQSQPQAQSQTRAPQAPRSRLVAVG
jgi:hypothetical protein